MDPFDDPEDRKDSLKRWFYLLIGLTLIFLTIIGAIKGWEQFHPLPSVHACQSIGYEAGIVVNGRTICYANCVDNVPQHCKKMRTL